eukprot:TRINITY_DN17412_c0_g1_i9.p1 TRINITY_DN17412_c0_g1~~TRINITY_DN17412_c0_g1_i9.p1  ORF type:complete len:1176 (+),score=294.57 TRINITY_DN17412_c0_g1_i9:60-3587(+)
MHGLYGSTSRERLSYSPSGPSSGREGTRNISDRYGQVLLDDVKGMQTTGSYGQTTRQTSIGGSGTTYSPSRLSLASPSLLSRSHRLPVPARPIRDVAPSSHTIDKKDINRLSYPLLSPSLYQTNQSSSLRESVQVTYKPAASTKTDNPFGLRDGSSSSGEDVFSPRTLSLQLDPTPTGRSSSSIVESSKATDRNCFQEEYSSTSYCEIITPQPSGTQLSGVEQTDSRSPSISLQSALSFQHNTRSASEDLSKAGEQTADLIASKHEDQMPSSYEVVSVVSTSQTPSPTPTPTPTPAPTPQQPSVSVSPLPVPVTGTERSPSLRVIDRSSLISPSLERDSLPSSEPRVERVERTSSASIDVVTSSKSTDWDIQLLGVPSSPMNGNNVKLVDEMLQLPPTPTHSDRLRERSVLGRRSSRVVSDLPPSPTFSNSSRKSSLSSSGIGVMPVCGTNINERRQSNSRGSSITSIGIRRPSVEVERERILNAKSSVINITSSPSPSVRTPNSQHQEIRSSISYSDLPVSPAFTSSPPKRESDAVSDMTPTAPTEPCDDSIRKRRSVDESAGDLSRSTSSSVMIHKVVSQQSTCESEVPFRNREASDIYNTYVTNTVSAGLTETTAPVSSKLLEVTPQSSFRVGLHLPSADSLAHSSMTNEFVDRQPSSSTSPPTISATTSVSELRRKQTGSVLSKQLSNSTSTDTIVCSNSLLSSSASRTNRNDTSPADSLASSREQSSNSVKAAASTSFDVSALPPSLTTSVMEVGKKLTTCEEGSPLKEPVATDNQNRLSTTSDVVESDLPTAAAIPPAISSSDDKTPSVYPPATTNVNSNSLPVTLSSFDVSMNADSPDLGVDTDQHPDCDNDNCQSTDTDDKSNTLLSTVSVVGKDQDDSLQLSESGLQMRTSEGSPIQLSPFTAGEFSMSGMTEPSSLKRATGQTFDNFKFPAPQPPIAVDVDKVEQQQQEPSLIKELATFDGTPLDDSHQSSVDAADESNNNHHHHTQETSNLSDPTSTMDAVTPTPLLLSPIDDSEHKETTPPDTTNDLNDVVTNNRIHDLNESNNQIEGVPPTQPLLSPIDDSPPHNNTTPSDIINIKDEVVVIDTESDNQSKELLTQNHPESDYQPELINVTNTKDNNTPTDSVNVMNEVVVNNTIMDVITEIDYHPDPDSVKDNNSPTDAKK